MDEKKAPPVHEFSLFNLIKRRFVQRAPRYPRPATSYTYLPLPSASRLEASLKESPFDAAHSPIASGTVLYLAYGSNLCYETFQGRRGIHPLTAVNVVVPELKLTFDLPGIPYAEPCFANSARRDAEDAPNPDIEDTVESAASEWSLVHDHELQHQSLDAVAPEIDNLTASQTTAQSAPLIGVVYEVTAKDYAHIIATEGSTYTDVVVTCTVLPTSHYSNSDSAVTAVGIPIDKPFKAHTLLAPPSVVRHSPTGKAAQPSLRYLTLCRNGAAEHDLPPEWQAYLGNLQHYEITTVSQKIGRTIFMVMLGPLFLTMVGLRAMFGKSDKGTPKWLGNLVRVAFKTVWITYDWILRPLFGEGERTEGKKV
jgi:hypothetical protein